MSRPPASNGKEIAILFLILVVLAIGYVSVKAVFRPPDIGRMSDRQLARHVGKIRTLLENSAGVIAGKNIDDSLELWFYPFSGEKPFLLDVSKGLGSYTPSPPYEPAFIYMRVSGKPLPIGECLQDLYSAITERGIYSLATYKFPDKSEVKRYIVDLYDFNIIPESKIGLELTQENLKSRLNLIPSPKGDSLYVIGNYARFPAEFQFGVIHDFRISPANETLKLYTARRESWIPPELEGENVRFYLDEPQPGDDGLFISTYAIKRSKSDGSEDIVFSAILRFATNAEHYDEKLSIASEIYRWPWSDGGSSRSANNRIMELCRMQPEYGRLSPEYVNSFIHIFYADKEKKIIGFIPSGDGSGANASLSAYDIDSGEITSLCSVNGMTRMHLVDYENRQMFLITAEKPSSMDNQLDGQASDSETQPTVNSPQRRNYWLNRIDLATLDVIPIRELKAAKRKTLYGTLFLGSPAITLCEQKELVVTIDGDSLVVIDYDGKLAQKLDTDENAGWNLVYAVNQLSPE